MQNKQSKLFTGDVELRIDGRGDLFLEAVGPRSDKNYVFEDSEKGRKELYATLKDNALPLSFKSFRLFGSATYDNGVPKGIDADMFREKRDGSDGIRGYSAALLASFDAADLQMRHKYGQPVLWIYQVKSAYAPTGGAQRIALNIKRATIAEPSKPQGLKPRK
jgi:hypothetical protein